jgi:homoserine kinase
MVNSSAEAFAPATVANLGVGFDILGLALSDPGDVVQVEPLDKPGAHILDIQGDGGKLPRESHKNTACVAANSVLERLGAAHGVGIRLEKRLPLASGLGSSAASAVAAAVAVNALFGSPLSMIDLLPACLDGEAAVSGYHADNVAPCLFGGITLSAGVSAEQIYPIPIPDRLHLALVTPDVEVPTATARAVLPHTVTLRQMVAQTAAVARVMNALYRGDVEALGAAMEADGVVEPARAHLMPLLKEMRVAAKQAGAFGLVISGAGPTLLAVCDQEVTAQKIATTMQMVYNDAGIACTARHARVAQNGARVLRTAS